MNDMFAHVTKDYALVTTKKRTTKVPCESRTVLDSFWTRSSQTSQECRKQRSKMNHGRMNRWENIMPFTEN